MCVHRLEVGVAERVDEFRGCAEEVDPHVVGIIEQNFRARIGRGAVVKHHCGFRCKKCDQPVPHHPPASGEVESAVALLDIAMKLLFLQMLQQGAAGTVHDTFRRAGRARGIQNVERVVERQLREVDILRVVCSREMTPVYRIRHRVDFRLFVPQREYNGQLDAR